ncbi:hypothetical protein Nepgr_008850 [Nepenthes gracilis]|uniref:Uncharacterized protein n=1 Tax=Nepenthes gracilis TaxID=150966 RepID=A0AAD3S9F1_NEPGR|nr:hypothetical protein Nepgr_008850 [Nepenthes gracilis]
MSNFEKPGGDIGMLKSARVHEVTNAVCPFILEIQEYRQPSAWLLFQQNAIQNTFDEPIKIVCCFKLPMNTLVVLTTVLLLFSSHFKLKRRISIKDSAELLAMWPFKVGKLFSLPCQELFSEALLVYSTYMV